VKSAADFVSARDGGRGAVREILDALIAAKTFDAET